MEQQPLQLRGQRMPRDREATIGSSELCKRVGHRLAYDHQGGRCKDDEGDEERDSRLHENTTARTGTERPDEAALALTDAAEGPGIPVESPRATSWLEPGSSAHETFKAVTTLASVCVALQRVPFGPI